MHLPEPLRRPKTSKRIPGGRARKSRVEGRNIAATGGAFIYRGMNHMKQHTFHYILAATLALTLTGPLLRGASPAGSLRGEVTDPSGAVVPNAKIVVSGDHVSATLWADETGQWMVGGLEPGTYEVAVSSDGFATFDRAGLVVSAGDKAEMDARLDLAILEQEITVTADAPAAGPGN